MIVVISNLKMTTKKLIYNILFLVTNVITSVTRRLLPGIFVVGAWNRRSEKCKQISPVGCSKEGSERCPDNTD